MRGGGRRKTKKSNLANHTWLSYRIFSLKMKRVTTEMPAEENQTESGRGQRYPRTFQRVKNRTQRLCCRNITTGDVCWPSATRCLCGRTSGLRRRRRARSCSCPPAGLSGTALRGRTPSGCSARSRSALKPPGSAGSGTVLWPCHGCPVMTRMFRKGDEKEGWGSLQNLHK